MPRFIQPDYTSQAGAGYPTFIDAAIAALARGPGALFNVQAEAPPSMSIDVLAGAVFDGSTLTEVAAQNLGPITAPAADPRIDRVVVDSATGTASIVAGTEAAVPTAPAIPAGKSPAARIALTVGMTEITYADITDERSLAALGLASTLAGEGLQASSSKLAINIGGLTSNTGPGPSDELAALLSGNHRRITIANLFKALNGLTQDGSPDTAADYILTYDASALAAKKVLLGDIGGGGLVPLLQASAGASASVDFETDIDATYEAYLFVLNNVRPATDDVDLWLRVGTGGTPTYQAGGVYDYINTFIQTTVGAAEEKLGGDTKLLLTSNENSARIGNDADGGFNGLVWLFNPASSAQRTMIRHESTWWPGSGGADVVVCEGGGFYDATTAVTAVRFQASSGNITSGEFRMYGLKTS